MDNAAYLILAEGEQDVIEDDEDFQRTAISALVVAHGILEAQRLRAERRSHNRHYLTRPELLPNPRLDTPWQQLYNSRCSRAYITTMGFDIEAFDFILDNGFEAAWNSSFIPRDDRPQTSAPRIHRRSLDAAGALGLVLHFLHSTMQEVSLMEIFTLIPATTSRYINFSLEILLLTLRKVKDAEIRWPKGDEFEELSQIAQTRHPLLTGAFGTIDGVNLPVQVSAEQEIENATYNGWLHAHFVSCVLAFSTSGASLTRLATSMANVLFAGNIIACRLNAPGSWHDSRIAQQIYAKLRDKTPEGYYLVADSAFPKGHDQIRGRIHAPIKEGTRLPADPIQRAEALAFNRQLLSLRQAAEWGNGMLQRVFGRLRVPLPIRYTRYRAILLELCFRLFNLRTRRVGLSQIRTVYMPIWQGDDVTWGSFGDVIFADQRRNDQVHWFHLVADGDE